MAKAVGLDTKKKSFLYLERNQEERRLFAQQLESVPIEARVYLDEAGVEDTLCPLYGWSAKGARCLAERRGHAGHRVSMAAAWCCGEVLAPLTFEGYGNSLLIMAWFEQQLCPFLVAGQVVILDNAPHHPMKELRALVQNVGCTLLPLPRYSPDLNKIEPLLAKIKNTIARDQTPNRSFRQKVDAAFQLPTSVVSPH